MNRSPPWSRRRGAAGGTAWATRIQKRAMPRIEAEIVNKLGLHARAAAKLTQLAAKFAAEVWLSRNGRRVNAKSIMGVMMLAAGKGSRVVIEADGEDAESALAAVVRLITELFGEEE